MADLVEYVVQHTQRGECRCGKCCDKGNAPDPIGHTIDMVFFKVAVINEPSKDEFLRLSQQHQGCFGDVDPFDGKEHSYLELGGWIGDQGLAMLYMALGVSLGLFTLLSPAMFGLKGDLAMQMAGVGMLSVQSKIPVAA